ncbi:MAG: beta-ketoacyl-[acyl-carrier-protein] synthase II [Planctomycetota bacterium]|nr:MAG: beta-ketoacyl-[acyl-carrier-protein] synthase II [Planctomycetota bacterium]
MLDANRRVVVTGVGAVTPLAMGAHASFERMLRGENGITQVDGWDTSAYATRIAGLVQGPVLKLEEHFTKPEQRRMDTFSMMGLLSAREACRDAGLAPEQYDAERAGSIFGTGIGGIDSILDQYAVLNQGGPRRITPFFVPNTMSNALAGNVAIEFGLAGPCFSTASACASSGHAIGLAMREIRSGAADLMVTGGSETVINALCMAGFNAARALSTRNDQPEKASRPFDRDRDGFVMGEGSGALVLESLEHARRRGARIYCELAGFGQSDDAGHITAPDESGRRPANSMRLALADAQMNPDEVDYINAHGTSTELNDTMETRAIKLALGEEAARRCAVSSTKSMIGHLLGAGSAVEAVATVLTVHGGVAHPTRNLEHPDVENGCDLDYIPGAAREQAFRAALSNSFGFGGHNVALAFRRHP